MKITLHDGSKLDVTPPTVDNLLWTLWKADLDEAFESEGMQYEEAAEAVGTTLSCAKGQKALVAVLKAMKAMDEDHDSEAETFTELLHFLFNLLRPEVP